ncbi:MAG TPA: hypothetical protein VGB61_00430, partial [Pyrinomonadaceae bacterium]
LIKTYVGTRYDERVVDALVTACESGRVNAASVKLRSRRLAEQSPVSLAGEQPQPGNLPHVEPSAGITPRVEPPFEQPRIA